MAWKSLGGNVTGSIACLAFYIRIANAVAYRTVILGVPPLAVAFTVSHDNFLPLTVRADLFFHITVLSSL